MLSRVYSGAVYGVNAYAVEIEVNAGRGDSQFVIVGLPDAAVRESRDRVSSALRNSGYALPGGKITINLSPADLRKEGAAFDLPIAVSILAASRQIVVEAAEKMLLIGEL